MSFSESIDSRTGGAAPQPIPAALRRAAMLEHPTLAVAAVENGRVRETNAAWRALFALPAGVAVESHVATLFPNAGGADRFERTLQAALKDPSGRASTVDRMATSSACEQMLARRDGSTFVAEVVVTIADRRDIDRPLDADAVWQVRDITVERTLRRELRDLEDYHRELSRHQSDVIFVIDRKGRIAYASSSVEEALGHPVNALLGEPFASLLEPEHAAAAEQGLRAACGSRAGAVAAGSELALHIRHADGTSRVVACRCRDCFDVPRVAGLVLHLTEAANRAADGAERAAAARLRAAGLRLAGLRADSSEAALAAVLEGVRDELGAATVSFRRAVDPAEARATDEEPGAGNDVLIAVAAAHDGQAPLLTAALGDAAERAVVAFADVRTAAVATDVAAAFGAAGIVAVIETPVLRDGRCVGWLAVGDARVRHWQEAELDFVVAGGLLVAQALAAGADLGAGSDAGRHDALTGLPDRAAASRRLDALAASAPSPWSVLVVDLVGLRSVNDRRGLTAGDAVIARVARLVVNAAGTDAFVARTDGGSFVVTGTGAARDMERMADSIVERVGDVASLELHEAAVEACVGVAHVVPGSLPPAGLAPLSQADLALREAKTRGPGRVAVFQPKLVAALETRNALDEEIEDALVQNEMTIFYQPQFALATGRVVGLEALVRWQHPTRGLLLPNAFVDVAFDRGLIDALTKTVLAQVCSQIASWRRAGTVAELPVAVNVSGRQFHDRRLPALVASALLKSGLPARLLSLEITEQSLTGEDAEVERVVRELSRLGVRIAVGDFNVGHASFRYLRQLQVSQVKLDKGFVRQLPHDAESVVVVGAVVELAKRLKYQVIAEGVETREQYEHLRSIGCEAGQGYFLGAPLPAEEVRAFLESHG